MMVGKSARKGEGEDMQNSTHIHDRRLCQLSGFQHEFRVIYRTRC